MNSDPLPTTLTVKTAAIGTAEGQSRAFSTDGSQRRAEAVGRRVAPKLRSVLEVQNWRSMVQLLH